MVISADNTPHLTDGDNDVIYSHTYCISTTVTATR